MIIMVKKITDTCGIDTHLNKIFTFPEEHMSGFYKCKTHLQDANLLSVVAMRLLNGCYAVVGYTSKFNV